MDRRILFVFKVGHSVQRRSKPLFNRTHHWRCYVDCWNPKYPLSAFVKKVTFKLHDTFENPKQVVRHAPFAIEEDGFGNFQLSIDVTFLDCVTSFTYDLILLDNNALHAYRTVQVMPSAMYDWDQLVRFGGIVIPENNTPADIHRVVQTIQSCDKLDSLHSYSFFPHLEATLELSPSTSTSSTNQRNLEDTCPSRSNSERSGPTVTSRSPEYTRGSSSHSHTHSDRDAPASSEAFMDRTLFQRPLPQKHKKKLQLLHEAQLLLEDAQRQQSQWACSSSSRSTAARTQPPTSSVPFQFRPLSPNIPHWSEQTDRSPRPRHSTTAAGGESDQQDDGRSSKQSDSSSPSYDSPIGAHCSPAHQSPSSGNRGNNNNRSNSVPAQQGNIDESTAATEPMDKRIVLRLSLKGAGNQMTVSAVDKKASRDKTSEERRERRKRRKEQKTLDQPKSVVRDTHTERTDVSGNRLRDGLTVTTEEQHGLSKSQPISAPTVPAPSIASDSTIARTKKTSKPRKRSHNSRSKSSDTKREEKRPTRTRTPSDCSPVQSPSIDKMRTVRQSRHPKSNNSHEATTAEPTSPVERVLFGSDEGVPSPQSIPQSEATGTTGIARSVRTTLTTPNATSHRTTETLRSSISTPLSPDVAANKSPVAFDDANDYRAHSHLLLDSLDEELDETACSRSLFSHGRDSIVADSPSVDLFGDEGILTGATNEPEPVTHDSWIKSQNQRRRSLASDDSADDVSEPMSRKGPPARTKGEIPDAVSKMSTKRSDAARSRKSRDHARHRPPVGQGDASSPESSIAAMSETKSHPKKRPIKPSLSAAQLTRDMDEAPPPSKHKTSRTNLNDQRSIKRDRPAQPATKPFHRHSKTSTSDNDSLPASLASKDHKARTGKTDDDLCETDDSSSDSGPEEKVAKTSQTTHRIADRKLQTSTPSKKPSKISVSSGQTQNRPSTISQSTSKSKHTTNSSSHVSAPSASANWREEQDAELSSLSSSSPSPTSLAAVTTAPPPPPPTSVPSPTASPPFQSDSSSPTPPMSSDPLISVLISGSMATGTNPTVPVSTKKSTVVRQKSISRDKSSEELSRKKVVSNRPTTTITSAPTTKETKPSSSPPPSQTIPKPPVEARGSKTTTTGTARPAREQPKYTSEQLEVLFDRLVQLHDSELAIRMADLLMRHHTPQSPVSSTTAPSEDTTEREGVAVKRSRAVKVLHTEEPMVIAFNLRRLPIVCLDELTKLVELNETAPHVTSREAGVAK